MCGDGVRFATGSILFWFIQCKHFGQIGCKHNIIIHYGADVLYNASHCIIGFHYVYVTLYSDKWSAALWLNPIRGRSKTYAIWIHY